MMSRDYTYYPEDENGNILWEMTQNGDNLSVPREVDFSVLFPSETLPLKFAVHLLTHGQKVSFSGYEANAELPWQVQAHPVMVPNYKNISGYESHLAQDAALLGGRNDGWGFFSN